MAIGVAAVVVAVAVVVVVVAAAADCGGVVLLMDPFWLLFARWKWSCLECVGQQDVRLSFYFGGGIKASLGSTCTVVEDCSDWARRI